MTEPDRGLVVSQGPVTTVRIDRPARANAVTVPLMQELLAVFQDLEGDGDVRAVVLTGTDRFFCAGADLKDQQEQLKLRGHDQFFEYLCDEWMPAVQRAMAAVWHAPFPVVAAINGAATAGGFDLALCCDYRIALPGAIVGSTYIELGIIPVTAGAYLLPRMIGISKALQLITLGTRLKGAEAAEIGVVDQLASTPDELLESAMEVAARMTSGPAQALAAGKRVVHEFSAGGFDDHQQRILAENRALFHTPVVQDRLLDAISSLSTR